MKGRGGREKPFHRRERGESRELKDVGIRHAVPLLSDLRGLFRCLGRYIETVSRLWPLGFVR